VLNSLYPEAPVVAEPYGVGLSVQRGGQLDLAVVIVNYNTGEDLRRCLRSISSTADAANAGLSCHVTVVDNGSSDGSAAMVRAEFPWVQVIETGRNTGYACANNIGLRALGYAGGKPLLALPRYALLLNPDTIVPPDALAQMVAFVDAHPDIGVAGPKLVRQDGSLDKACRRGFPTPAVAFYRFSGLGRLFPRHERFGRYNMTFLSPDVQADVDAVVGAFMLMRTEALEQAGLLDETFFMYGEDLDLCYRIKQFGWRVVYNPSVTVLHVKGAASRKNSRRAIVAFYEAMRIFHNKHYRSKTPLPINWLVDLGISLLCRFALLRDRLTSSGQKRVASA